MATTKINPANGELLRAARRPRGSDRGNGSAYVWLNDRYEHVLDATPEEDADIHLYFDTDHSITGR
ncbi:hypothetical protein [Leifsonia poae]|uniref:hypothetical protein n=1 Tax=Leifsonia poae TaxID=110933 RepID=UPI001CBAA564|nr:hypothetical protein [Leifsonia poae]